MRTPEEKAAQRKKNAEEFARRIMESQGITLEEHARRLARNSKERALVLKDEGLEEEDEEE